MRSRKILSILLVLLTLLSFLPLGQAVYAAEEEPTYDVSGSKTAEPTELDSDHRETTVTLSLPSAEYQNKIDIVFAMDSSTSAENSTVFIECVNELFESILSNNPNLDLKVGVVRFRGRAHDAIAYLSENTYTELVTYSDDTKTYIERALSMTEDEVKAAFGSGSNTHGGIDIANEWLKADEEVDDDHKYLVLLTDGKTYIWNDASHEPTTIYAQWYRSNSYAIQNSGKPALNQVVGYNKYDYPTDVLDYTGKSNIFVFRTIEDLLACTAEELTGVSEWDQFCRYADTKATPNGTVVKHTMTNGAELFGSNTATYGKKGDFAYWYEFTPNDDWTGVKYLEANPFMVIDNGDGTYTFDTENVNPNYYQYHVDPLQKGIYKAAKLWQEVNTKYNCAVITYDGGSADGGLQLRLPFNQWLRDNSKYGASIATASQVEALFTGIDNSIRYMVAEGVVTDQITEDFTLKNPDNADGFRMTLSGTALDVTFEDGKWNFGEANADGVYPYVVEFDASTNTITWTLNVPIENTNPVTLSYDLIIDEDSESGFYDTNVSAVLDYKSSDGTKDGTFTFEIPVVSYIRKIDISVSKLWKDENNQDGKRPGSLTFSLMDGDTVVQTVQTDASAGWIATFTGVPEAKLVDGEMVFIDYTVVEEKVDGYSAEMDETADGFVIVNTHDPEKTDITVEKVWDDESNERKLRPDVITVNLLADGETVDTARITADDEWKHTFTGLDKYKAGKLIDYTVEEEPVEGYKTIVDGFTITNTLTVPKEYTITYKLNGGKYDGKTADIKEVYPEGTVISIHAAPTREGYKFLRWEGSSYQPGDKYTVVSDHTFVAQWEPEKPEEPKPPVPPTGDNSRMGLWLGMMVLSATAAAGLTLVSRKRRSGTDR